MNGGKFLFTIEQLELIRRLRNSGVTKQQVLYAFDSLERVDHQLGDIYTIPLSLVTFLSICTLYDVILRIYFRPLYDIDFKKYGLKIRSVTG